MSESTGVHAKTCRECGSGYTGSGYKYCSDRCRAKAHRKQKTSKQREYNARPGVATAKSERDRAWRQANPDKVWAHSLRSHHHMTPDQWLAMLMEQAGSCYLCGQPLPGERAKIAIDHDHQHCPDGYSCGHCRRGLAHHACNTAIGLLGENPELMRIVAANLERVKEVTQALLLTAPVQLDLLKSVTLRSADRRRTPSQGGRTEPPGSVFPSPAIDIRRFSDAE